MVIYISWGADGINFEKIVSWLLTLFCKSYNETIILEPLELFT